MNRSRILTISFSLAAVLTLAGCGGEAARSGSFRGASPDTVAAKVGSQTITLGDVDASIPTDLRRIDMELYQARKTKLEQMVEETLLSQKAKTLGISADELVKREITDKATPASDDKVKEYFDKFKGQIRGTYEDVAPKIREALGVQAKAERRKAYLAELRKESQVKIAMTPPRVEVAATGGQEDGPKDAPITLVEFSDFQCPFCGRSQATVAEVMAKYSGKIRHVFMDFPLGFHPMAKPAAVAGRCAAEQGKFWEYHKVLFERQRELNPENYKKWAGELGLDSAKFDECTSSTRFEEDIHRSIEQGQKAGVSGTPGFFINGVMINGAQPFEVFKQIIDDELARKKG